MQSIISSALIFLQWKADDIPAVKTGLEHSFITQCSIEKKAKAMELPLVIRSRYIIYVNKVHIFYCLSEKVFNLYKVRSLINSELILKLILLNNMEFDINFNVKKFGSSIAFAKLPHKPDEEFVEEARLISLKLNEIQSGF
jgi:hypothetical protein